jgi:histidinol-phosphate aminotransferase
MQTPILDPVACSGLSRRNFLRIAAATSALASVPVLTESRLAFAQRPKFADPNKGIHIDANENPLGPSESARKAIAEIIPKGGRYEFPMQMELGETFAKMEGFDPSYVDVYAGSSEPLHFTVMAFTSKDKPLVIADPGYEAPMWAANISGAPIIKVPLLDPKGAATHDVKAMLAASTTPGVI